MRCSSATLLLLAQLSVGVVCTQHKQKTQKSVCHDDTRARQAQTQSQHCCAYSLSLLKLNVVKVCKLSLANSTIFVFRCPVNAADSTLNSPLTVCWQHQSIPVRLTICKQLVCRAHSFSTHNSLLSGSATQSFLHASANLRKLPLCKPATTLSSPYLRS